MLREGGPLREKRRDNEEKDADWEQRWYRKASYLLKTNRQIKIKRSLLSFTNGTLSLLWA